jgi:excinuclease ABC subunit C
MATDETNEAPHRLTGAALIAEKVRTLPNAPGVYRMIDRDDEVIYVGKARDLKKRVSTYAKSGGHANRIARMILNTADMAFVQTASETEALLLEANLIKRYRPRYNVLMRDDKSFANILLTGDHPFPQIVKHRGARSRKGDYFGPFASAGAVGRTLNTLQRAFLLRSCTDSVFESRTRPCLLFQIKRCSAPCTGRIDEASYKALVSDAEAFLTGRSRAVTEALGKRMEEAAANLEFETAARLRDRIRSLAHVQQTQGINPQSFEDADVFAIHGAHGETCIQVFFFRSGQNWGNRAYFPLHDRGAPLDEVLDAFLAQFYDTREAPKLILISDEIPDRALLAEALSVRQERKVEVAVPQRGEKKDIVDAARMNARDALMRRQAESAAETELLQGVADVFGLPGPPQRIEVYDNSHIQGSKPVGGMIVAGPRGFEKGQYRKFNIKSAAGNDDFAMMREMLGRRFARLVDVKKTDEDAAAPIFDENTPDTDDVPDRPDLILIDGGLGQLSSALDAMREAGVEGVTIAGISKGPDRDAGRENFHLPGKPAFMLEPNHPVLFYLQRLRDEAHRFAIGTHRARRSKAITDSPLDAIDGIGGRRKRALLLHFGSAKSIRNASVTDLAAVDGISEALARRIHDHFRA